MDMEITEDMPRPELGSVGEEYLESRNRAVRYFAELMERWDNRLTFKGLPTAKDYADGRYAIALYFKVSSAGDEAEVLPGGERDTADIDDVLILVLHHEVGNLCGRDHRNNQLMFVDNVELVEGPDGLLPSFVWLYRVKDKVDQEGHELLYFSLLKHISKAIPGLVKREITCGFRPTMCDDDFAHHEIESGSHVVDSISENERNIFREWTGFDCGCLISGLRVRLSDQTMTIGLDKGLEPFFKLDDVAIGPFNL